MNEPRSPKVLLAVGGGIAAYKAPEIVRALVTAGAEVQVVMTPSADAFVTPLSLSAVSRRPVRRTLLDAAEEGRIGHIELADWADVVVVAPATANLMARAAAGMADDLVTTVLLATRAPVLWAPAMNTNMWRHPATVHNLATLAGRGARFVGPDRGELACGWIGEGRMIDPAVIAESALAIAGQPPAAESWAGRTVVVTAGPTQTAVDPVRFLTNASTGEMGFAMAAAAAARGAAVTIVAGPVHRPTPAGVRRVDVVTADEMLAAVVAELDAGCDLLAMVAAVSDLAIDGPHGGKLDKADLVRAMSTLPWKTAPDILATVSARYRPHCAMLGFAAQTVDVEEPEAIEAALVEAGRRKLTQKGCDAVFVNRVGAPGTGFGSPTNAGVLVIRGEGPDATVHPSGPPVPKAASAAWILDRIEGLVIR